MARPIVNYDFVDDSEMVSSVEGDLVKYAVEYSTMSVPNPNWIESSDLANGDISSDFYGSHGSNLGGDDFYDATGEDGDTFAEDSMPDQTIDEYENVKGKKRKKKKGFFNKLLDVQAERQKMKFGAKDKMAQAQLESARQQGALAQSDVATATALANASKSSGSNAKTSGSSDGSSGWGALSSTAKIGIVLGGVAVIGLTIFFVMKKKKK